MAQVPQNPGQSVLPQSEMPLENIHANPGAFGAPIAAGLENLGASTKQASDMLEAHALAMQGLKNKADSDQAAIASDTSMNQLSVDFAENVKGANATPKAYEDYVGKLSTARETARAALTSPMAQALFDANTRRTQFAFAAEASRHIASEQNKYVTTSSMNLAQNAADLYTAHPNDPTMEHNFLDTVQKQSRFLALHNGEDTPDVTNPDGTVTKGHSENSTLMALKVQGATYAEVAKVMQTTDPLGAQAFIKSREALMDPGTYARTLGELRPSVMSTEAANIAADAKSRVMSAVTGGPTGFAKFDTPEAGMAAADANLAGYAKHGINTLSDAISRWAPPSENDTAAYIARVAKDTGIDPNAKLNLSDPAVRRQMLTSMAKVEQGKNNNPLNLRNLAHGFWAGQSVDSAVGGTPTSEDIRSGLQAAENYAVTQAQAKYPGLPQFAEQARSAVQASFNRDIGAQRDVEQSAGSELLGDIMAKQISDKQTLFAADPHNLDKYNALPASDRKHVDAALTQEGNQYTLERQQGLAQYTGLYANRFNDPQAFLNADLSAIPLTTSDRKTAMKEQIAFRAKPIGLVDKPFNDIIHSPEFVDVMSQLGIAKNVPKQPGQISKDYSHLLGVVSAELDGWRAGNPQKVPQPKDMQGILARATALQGTYHNTFLGVPYGAAVQQTEGDHASTPFRAFDVPESQRANAMRAVTALGMPMSEENIAKVYHDFKMRGGR